LMGLVVGVVLLFMALTGIVRVASEHERFAVIELGRFKGLKGPGVFFKFSRHLQWLRVKLGDRGELLAPGVARIAGGELPVTTNDPVSARQFVRVIGFEGKGSGSRLVVELDPDQRREIQCLKCGHVMELE